MANNEIIKLKDVCKDYKMGDSVVRAVCDANITINGTIWAKDNSEITIRSSILWLEVPSPELVLIEKQYDGPHGFLLTDDGASLTIKDSFIYLHRHDIELYQPEGWLVPSEVMVNFGNFYMDNSYLKVCLINIGTLWITLH